jgi:type I restriction enzyme M protein
MPHEFSGQLANCLAECGNPRNDYSANLMAAYALFIAQSESPDAMPPFRSILTGVRNNALIQYSIANTVADCWDALRAIYGLYDTGTIADFILNADLSVGSRRYPVTPGSIIALALEILNIGGGDAVADFGTGYGGFLVSAFKENSGADYYGIEIQNELAAIAAIRAELLGRNVAVEQGNMFSPKEKRQFSKIFANYPFGIRNVNESADFLDHLGYKLPKGRSSDWVFNLLLLESLRAGGKAAGIMTCGACFNGADREMREFFVRSGFVEAMIALPEHIFVETSVPTEMIILSRGNATIRMVDASNLCKKIRRQSEFTDEHIREIVFALRNDTDFSRLVSPADLEDGGYNLDPTKRFEKPVQIQNGIRFGDVIRGVTRAAQLNADTLDEISSNEPTDYQYLMPRDIQDGIINSRLPFLKSIEAPLEKHCISPGNLLVSKNGAPFKVAVVEETGGKSILANGNLYVVELDETRIKPYYLKAFFESEIGTRTLNSIAVGTAMPVIQVETLKSVIIPCPSLQEQGELEKRYLQSVETIRALKGQLVSAIELSRNFFKEGD